MIAKICSEEDRIVFTYNVTISEGMPYAAITLDDHVAAVVVWAETQKEADARAEEIVAAINGQRKYK